MPRKRQKFKGNEHEQISRAKPNIEGRHEKRYHENAKNTLARDDLDTNEQPDCRPYAMFSKSRRQYEKPNADTNFEDPDELSQQGQCVIGQEGTLCV